MIIKSKQELNTILEEEKRYIFKDKNLSFDKKFRRSFKVLYYKYLSFFRKAEYFSYKRDNSTGFVHHCYALKIKLLSRRLNSLSMKTGIDFSAGDIEKYILVCHPNVIINGRAGQGCIFHGNNVLGNKSTGSDETPVLGENVDVGTGAIIIGNVKIADNCVIGAGAVVTKSFEIPGSVIAGVPAKLIK